MAQRQAPDRAVAPPVDGPGRVAQKRRTRAAILDATTRLVAAGETPSVDDVAAAADVSRRTVYLYFPTLDQLLLDATVGALSAATIGATLGRGGESGDAIARIDALARSLAETAPTTLPLGRKLIQLTVDAPPTDQDDGPRRGYRRIGWIEEAVEPLREKLTPEQLDRLVSALAIVVGWEAMVVLRDVRGAAPDREEQVLRWAATSLVQAMTDEASGAGRNSRPRRRTGGR